MGRENRKGREREEKEREEGQTSIMDHGQHGPPISPCKEHINFH